MDKHIANILEEAELDEATISKMETVRQVRRVDKRSASTTSSVNRFAA